MPPSFYCQVCGALAFPYNSNLVNGQRFVHRECRDRAVDDAIDRYVKEGNLRGPVP